MYRSLRRPATMPARDSWQSGRNTTSTLSSRYSSSTMAAACSIPSWVMSLRWSLKMCIRDSAGTMGSPEAAAISMMAESPSNSP